MSSSPLARLHPRRAVPLVRSVRLSELARRLAYFWVVWSALLLVHEGGHAVAARRQGLDVARVTVGVGPVLWRGQRGDTQLRLRLVPVAGVTTIRAPHGGISSDRVDPHATDRSSWGAELATLAGGVLATLSIAVIVAGMVALRERGSAVRWRWGRFVVADAIVLTVFNFLPIPPLDGGRAVLGAFAAWHGSPLAGDALFWVQTGGFVLAVLPMLLWTRWTARIDALALRWGAPAPA